MFAHPRIKKVAPAPPKRRKTVHKIEEITFDKDARAEYLSGFHKRKVERSKQAKEQLEAQARLDKISARKQVREERRQAVKEHIDTVHKLIREARTAGLDGSDSDSDGEEWQGLSDEGVPEEPLNREDEYIDEDRYTTVTVEAVSVDRDGLHKPTSKQDTGDQEAAAEDAQTDAAKDGSRKRPRENTNKKKKFRYESKLERRITERKQQFKRFKGKE
ncbi:nucleolar protein 12-domain-containing protein [Lasiosphaeria miniovina]|uniref:Nucleolar protein 12-domain-containing protein n=1 Tax=Lasiosphaeria miniovina TaxID=1954250 RepID=A0AA40B561_9PEZI|nr:nucleolar protein 12-domain-containing protein [Lasiosphaeria miniovina]KAK0727886.1 nucleolar protein 12-domain-containing protein [Lasiosphaeria miniovina]